MKKLFLVLAVGLILLVGYFILKPERCPDVYQPVCGKDQVTYKNPCFLQKAGIEPTHPGVCETIATKKTCEAGTKVEGEKILLTSKDLVCRKLYQFEYTLDGLDDEAFEQNCKDLKYLAETEKKVRQWFKVEGNKGIEQRFEAIVPGVVSGKNWGWTYKKVERDESIDKEGYFALTGFPNVKVVELKIYEISPRGGNLMYREADKIQCPKASEQQDSCGDGICSGDEVMEGHGCMRDVCLVECPEDCKELSAGTEEGCPDEYEPICGTDGITYRNACELRKAQMQVEYLGAC